MSPGKVGAALVVTGGALLGVLVFAKDRAQLGRATASYEEARTAFAAGRTPDAKKAFETALDASLRVGNVAGLRPRALELAQDARRAIRACEALEALKAGRPQALGELDGASGTGARALAKEPIDKVVTAHTGKLVLDAAKALEQLALDTDKLAPEPSKTKVEHHELATKAYEQAEKVARASGLDWAEDCVTAARRTRTRALVAHALEANARDDGAEAKRFAEEALKALEADPFKDPAEKPALLAGTEKIFNESKDRDRVNELEQQLAALEAKVGTNELGNLRGQVEALKLPELTLNHRAKAELEKKLAAATELLGRLRKVATEFEGMVLARDGMTKVYVDRLEVTNALYKRFADETKAYGDGKTKDVWGDEATAKSVEYFLDASFKTAGPATWTSGNFPEGQERHPVAGISGPEARAFARWAGKRLPTLDEWVGAAGHPLAGAPPWPWGRDWKPTGGNVKGSGKDATAPVGSFPDGAASTGALDLIGNVREIVEEGGSLRSVGGSYLSKSDLATLTGAVALSAEARPKDQGFRCARELVWKR